MFLLDTDILTLYFQANRRVLEHVQRSSGTDLVATCVVSRIEVLTGRFEFFLKAANRDELCRARDALLESERNLARIPHLPMDDAAAVEFERLRNVRSLKKIGRGDLLIACIALANRATLVTRNVKDFKLVSGLRVENWAD